MKTKDLREKSVEELTALLDEQQLNQFRLRMATVSYTHLTLPTKA